MKTFTVRSICRSLPKYGGGSIRFTSTISPLELYDQRVETGRLRNDEYQRGILSNLEHLHTQLKNYTPPDVAKPDITASRFIKKSKSSLSGLFGSIFGTKQDTGEALKDKIPHGIYLYGDVGCGKTMLMDLFYDTIPPHLAKKRLHFHQFMQSLHKRAHQLKQENGHREDIDVMPYLAWELSKTATVLCFDEFQVTDVADAMLLRRLLNLGLRYDHGLVLFATSNRAPDELYINGIQRESFVPCIELIKNVTNVIYLKSPTDYRKIPRPVSSVYYFPKPGIKYTSKACTAERKQHVENWYSFFSQDHAAEKDIPLKIWGRELIVPKCSPPYVGQFTFKELCGQPLAAGDYLTLATNFESIIVTDIPFLSVNQRDEVRRFITFLDAVYDNHTRLAVTAAAPFTDIFVEPEDIGKGAFILANKSPEELDDKMENDTLVAQHGFDKKIAMKAYMFAHLDEERFAFARALSRLTQMATQSWVDNYRPRT
ncbi:Afg1 protein [Martiniozyma asiatica (nom. inval.)]|nr:Afg1 protein [Martiniozyma asiatica]